MEKRRNCSKGAISPLFHNIFNISLTSRVQLHIYLLNGVNRISFSPNSANLICRSTDISKYFRESLGIRDNESRLYIQENEILTSFQPGFVTGDSTTFQHLHTYHAFCEAVDAGKEVRVFFCDISKAFDRVWHRGLLYKLFRIGCSDHVIKWFSSCLSNRRQCVILSGALSEWASVYAGVPQGSILGPLLFLIFINDIIKNINSSIRLFADDTSLYIIIENPQTAVITMNLDLGTISQCRPRWLSWMRRPTGDQEVAGSTPAEVGNVLSWRLIVKYFLRSFSPFR